jgi:hypothetical protein
MLIPWHYDDIDNVAFWRHLRHSEFAMRNDAKLSKRTWRITSDVTRNSFRDSGFVAQRNVPSIKAKRVGRGKSDPAKQGQN